MLRDQSTNAKQIDIMELDVISARIPKRDKKLLNEHAEAMGTTTNKIIADYVNSYNQGRVLNKDGYMNLLKFVHRLLDLLYNEGYDPSEEAEGEDKSYMEYIERILYHEGFIGDDDVYTEILNEEEEEEEEEEEDEFADYDSDDLRSEIERLQEEKRHATTRTNYNRILERQNEVLSRLMGV